MHRDISILNSLEYSVKHFYLVKNYNSCSSFLKFFNKEKYEENEECISDRGGRSVEL